jgi:peptidoglycan/xylan/chitin deacetylase (PgdA/CDA1 family)
VIRANAQPVKEHLLMKIPTRFSSFVVAALCIAMLNAGTATTTHADDATPDTSPTTTLPLQPEDVRVITRVPTKDKVVFITIDDGFTPTPELARIIRTRKVPITTFAMPRLVKRNIDWFRAQSRMTFENHTINHSSLTFFGIKRQRYEICGANNQIKRIMGDRPQLFRPPGGNWTPRTLKALAKCNIKYLVMWSGIAEKGRLRIPDGKLQRGDIILMHYIPSAAPTLELLLDQMERQGLKPALLRDYLK